MSLNSRGAVTANAIRRRTQNPYNEYADASSIAQLEMHPNATGERFRRAEDAGLSAQQPLCPLHGFGKGVGGNESHAPCVAGCLGAGDEYSGRALLQHRTAADHRHGVERMRQFAR